jgi:hypothetical protein
MMQCQGLSVHHVSINRVLDPLPYPDGPGIAKQNPASIRSLLGNYSRMERFDMP